MRMKKLIAILSAAALLIFGFGSIALAQDVPDITRPGSISITMRCDGQPVAGGSLTIYRVADIAEDDGNYRFELTADYQQSNISLDDIGSPDTAAALAEYALMHEFAGQSKAIDESGSIIFDGLLPGLYLLIQDTPAPGYNNAAPFLVSLPRLVDGIYIYDIDASPKVELEHGAEPTEPPATEPPIPQTGQLNWPIPILTIVGISIFSAGWLICFGKKENKKENNEEA